MCLHKLDEVRVDCMCLNKLVEETMCIRNPELKLQMSTTFLLGSQARVPGIWARLVFANLLTLPKVSRCNCVEFCSPAMF